MLNILLLLLIADDEIQSHTSVGRLAYTMPSLPELFDVSSYEPFSNHFATTNDEAIGFELKIHNNADASTVECASSNKCRAQYRLRYTPILYDVSPSNVYYGQQLSFYLNPHSANYDFVLRDDADPVDFIKLGGTRCDQEGIFDNEKRLDGYSIGTLKAISGDQHPGN